MINKIRRIIWKIKEWWKIQRLKKYDRQIAVLVKENGVLALRQKYADGEITHDVLVDCYRVVTALNPSRKTIKQITEILNSVRNI